MPKSRKINPVSRKIRYLFQAFPLIRKVRNWYQIPLTLFNSGKKVVLQLKTGEQFTISHLLDALTIKEIFLDQDYKVNLSNPEVIIDIGANIGTFSILQAKKHPQCNIYAFEPAKATNKLLKTNLRLNGIKNVIISQKGVGAKPGKHILYTHSASGLSSLINTKTATRPEKISITTLDQIFQNHKIKKCDLLKMDCEGAEFEILFNTSGQTFKKIKNLVLEYHDGLTKHSHCQLINFLKDKKFTVKKHPHPLEENIGIIYAKK